MATTNDRLIRILTLLILITIGCKFLSSQNDLLQRDYISLVCVQKDDNYGFVDEMGEEVIPCKFDQPSAFSEGWVALKNGKNWSYYDASGKKVLDLKNRFTYCGEFHDGAAFVSTLPTKGAKYNTETYWKNIFKELQFIDKKGEVLFKIDNAWGVSYRHILRNGFSDGWLRIPKERNPSTFEILFGYLDKTGQLKLPIKFRAESNASADFSEGLADLGKRTYLPNEKKPVIKYGFINKDGNWQIPPIYTMVYPFKHGVAMVKDTMPNSNLPAFLIDKEGNRIFPLDVETYPRKMRDSLIAVSKVERSEKGSEISGTRRHAIAKVDGTMITDFIFGDLDPGTASEDLWRASPPEDNKTIGYVNDKGEVVIPYQFSRGSLPFYNGLAIVRVKEGNHAQAVINTKGEFVMPPDSTANFQITGGIILNNVANGGKYNKNGQPINLESYTVRGPYQYLAFPGQ